MGVAGLWEILRPAGQVRSLTELAVTDGFTANPSHQRGFRIGIDASIWFFHATYGREGENPELRTLFFRCCRLLHAPLLPLFVFDGPYRPAIKRGKRVGGNAHWLTHGMKNIIEAFGFEWRVAPGEAEAELAYLNRIGVIDAVLSDDVDNFLFGATMVIRNPSSTLSGNRAHPVRNAQGKDDGNHVVTYTADAILTNSSVSLSRSGTILIGLLSGGDYVPAGLPGCGQKFAVGLARAGFGDSLVQAVGELKGAELNAFLDEWRQDLRAELKVNKSGFLPSKKPSLAASLPDDFPSLAVLISYVDPIISENTPSSKEWKQPSPATWRNDPDPMRIASICELYFEWGVKDVIIRRFRTVLWPGVVCRAIRRTALCEDRRQHHTQEKTTRTYSEDDDAGDTDSSPATKRITSTLSTSKKSSASAPSDSSTSPPFSLSSLMSLVSPSSSGSASSSSADSEPSPLLVEIHSERTHASTDGTPEYRVTINPIALVERAESGVKGIRPPLVGGLFGTDLTEDEEDGGDDESGDEDNADGIERLETTAAAASKSGVKKRKAATKELPNASLRLWLPSCMIRAVAPDLVEAYEVKGRAKVKRGKKGGATASRKAKASEVNEDDVEDSMPGPSASKTTAGRSKPKPRTAGAGVGGRRRKPKQASEAQDDAYEYIDLSAGESPCSSDEGGGEGDKKGKGKARVEVTAAEPTKKKTINASSKTTTANTVKDFYKVAKTANRTNASRPGATKATAPNRVPLYEEEEESDHIPKPSTMRLTVSNPSSSRSLNSGPTRGVPRYEEEEEEEGPAPPSKSIRPLDVLRARSKVASASSTSSSTPNSKQKTTSIPRYEEEEEEEDLPPSSLSSSKSTNPQAKKRPVFVNVSDTDSDIEVNDGRRPSGNVAMTAGRWASGDMNGAGGAYGSNSTGGNKASPTLISEKRAGKAADVDDIIDLVAKRVSKTASTPTISATTPICAAFVPSRPSSSAPVASRSGSAIGLSGDAKGTAPIARSTSKLAHILLSTTLESEEEGPGEGDELPTFHQESAKSTGKSKAPTAARPAPRPFPMQLPSDSFVSPPPSRAARNAPCDVSDDEVEIVDVFITPRSESPPRSPTPSPSVIKPRPVHASAGPSMGTHAKAPSAFPASPTRSTTQPELRVVPKARQRRRPSNDSDGPSPTTEEGILKSPRKSAKHTSPRHLSHSRPESPTPLGDSSSRTIILRVLDNAHAELCLSTSRQATPERVDMGHRPRPSDESAIYISSGSEDEEDDARQRPGSAEMGGETEVEAEDHNDDGGDTDLDLDGRADTGMIMSAPPSPVRSVSLEIVESAPKRTSKFKPALGTASRVPSVDHWPSTQSTEPLIESHDAGEKTTVSQPTRRLPPLHAARSKRTTRTDDIIDLTSD